MIPVARSMLTVGCFVLVGSIVTLLASRPGTAGFVVSSLAALTGLVIVCLAIVWIRWTLQREHQKEEG